MLSGNQWDNHPIVLLTQGVELGGGGLVWGDDVLERSVGVKLRSVAGDWCTRE